MVSKELELFEIYGFTVLTRSHTYKIVLEPSLCARTALGAPGLYKPLWKR